MSKVVIFLATLLLVSQSILPSGIAVAETLATVSETMNEVKTEETETMASTEEETKESVPIPIEPPEYEPSLDESAKANDSPEVTTESTVDELELSEEDEVDRFLKENNLGQNEDGKLFSLTGSGIMTYDSELFAKTFPMLTRAGVTVYADPNLHLPFIKATFNESSDTIWGWYLRRANGKIAYCVEPGVDLNLGNNAGYSQKVTSDAKAIKASLAHYYGYEKSSHTMINEMKTQFLVREIVNGVTPATMSGEFTMAEYQTFKKSVMDQVDMFYKTVSFAQQTVKLKVGESITLTDSTGAFSKYEPTADMNNTGTTVTKSGNKVTIKANSTSNDGRVRFVYDIDEYYRGPALYYTHPQTQNVMTMGLNDPKSFTFNVEVEKNGNALIKKVDADTGAAIAGATFKLSYGATTVEKVTNAKGEIALNDILADTVITVQEVKAKNGYVLNKVPQKVTIKPSETVGLTFTNKKQVGTARLFKEDSKTGAVPYGDKYSLENAVYGLFQADGTKIKSVTLKNLNGRIQAEVANLQLGDYYWQEEKAPEGYLINKTKLPFSLTYAGQNETTTLTEKVAKDVAQLGKATLIKEDSETGHTTQGEAVLEGVVYGLFHSNGTKVNSVTLAEKDGKVQAAVADLKLGDYYWQEEKAPVGYQLNTKKLPFSLIYAGETVTTSTHTQVATDDVMKGQFDLFKFGNYNWTTTAWNWLNGQDHSSEIKEGLKGAEFTVYQHFGEKKEVARQTTDKTGYLVFKTLPYGTYRVKETNTPKGYKTVADFYVTISAHGQSFHYSIENKVKEAQLKIVKVDSESGKAIPRADAGFEIYSRTTGEQLILKDLTGADQSVFFTNKEGFLQLPALFAFGEYRIKEVQAPKGYVLAKEEVNFSVTGDETDGIVLIKFKNDNQKGQIKLHKDVQTASSLATEDTDHGEVTHIEYTQQSGEGFKFKIKATKDIKTPEGTIKQKAGTYVSYDGKDLVLVTDKKGNVSSLPILYIGSYELEEVEAPAGVVMLKEPQPFQIEYAGQAVEITSTTVSIENDIQTIEVIGYKSQEVVTGWENGQAVVELEKADNGQVFALRNETDKLIGTETLVADTTLAYLTVEEGELHFSGHLPQGNYYLQEVTAGDDHVLDETRYSFDYVAVDNLDNQTIHVWADSTAVNKQGFTRMARTPIVNTLARASIQLIKTDALDGKPLENVAFDLIKLEGVGEELTETIISKHATDAEGKIVIENLPTGVYKLVETRPLDWYENNTDGDELIVTVSPDNDDQLIELEAVNQRKPLEITTLFATTKDGSKQANPDIDNPLIDTIQVKGMKPEHTYYVTTKYVNRDTKDIVDMSESTIVNNEDGTFEFATEVTIPKGKMTDASRLTATHYIYEDEEKTKEIGREDKLDNDDQTVTFKTPKVAIKTKAHTGDDKSQRYTHGDIIKAYDNINLTHTDVLDGTKRAVQAILVADIPGKGQKDIWTSEKINYVVKDAAIVKQVMTDVDTSKYPEGTTFFFKEIGYNEAGEEDTKHNFDGKDRNQSLTPKAPKKILPQTGEQLPFVSLFLGMTLLVFGLFMLIVRKQQELNE